MTPVEIARKLCDERGGDFRDEMEAFLLGGYVFSTPDLFVMAKAVPHGAEMESPWDRWPEHRCDSLMIWCGVGSPRLLLAHLPKPDPLHIGWVRQGRGWKETHWVETSKLRARFSSHRESY